MKQVKRYEMVLEEFGDNIIIEAEDMADAAGQVADAVEAAFGWRPVINDQGRIRWYQSGSGRVFEGEPEFRGDDWLRSPNWAQVIEEAA